MYPLISKRTLTLDREYRHRSDKPPAVAVARITVEGTDSRAQVDAAGLPVDVMHKTAIVLLAFPQLR